jgi:hypothetical protein
MNFWPKNYFSKNDPIRSNSMRKVDRAYSRRLKMLPWSWFRISIMNWKSKFIIFYVILIFASIHWPKSRSRKHFQASEMLAIDFPHRITSNRVIFRKIMIFRQNFRTRWPDSLTTIGGSKIKLSKLTPKTIRKCFPDLETVF